MQLDMRTTNLAEPAAPVLPRPSCDGSRKHCLAATPEACGGAQQQQRQQQQRQQQQARGLGKLEAHVKRVAADIRQLTVVVGKLGMKK
jgi:hypothetical protein